MAASVPSRGLRFLAVLVAIVGSSYLVGAAGAAPTAAGHQSSSGCERRSGTAWLQNRLAVVYAHQGRVYACGSPSGASVFLFRAKTGSHRIRLAGRYVVWEPETAFGLQRIAILNVHTRKVRRVGSLLTGGHMIGPGIADFVVGNNATVVWLDDMGSEEGPFSSFSSTLYVNSGRGDSVLDHQINSVPVFPISSFGLSSNGEVVYWTDDGQVRSASVS